MENNIREYIDELFAAVPQTRKTLELREEMKQNLIDKYNDLVAEGNTPEQAYYMVIDSLGDINELFAEMENEEGPYWPPYTPPVQKTAEHQHKERPTKEKSKNPVLDAVIGAGWLLLIAAYFVVSFTTGRWYITWVLFLIGGAASSLIKLIFGGNDRRNIMSAITGAIWCILIAVYFAISFATQAWHMTWIIFLVGAAISVIFGAIGSAGEEA